MKKIILLLLISVLAFGQNCDIPIKTSIYSGCFSKQFKNPLFISYKLYHGGGSCSRKGVTFKSKPYTAKQKDYSNSGYEEGHMCPAGDFAYNSELEKLTFFFDNCMPQTENLNKGIWKSRSETPIRNMSKYDSLMVVCGGIFGDEFIGDSVYIPVYCWKIVQSLSTLKVVYCEIFTNKISDNTYQSITREELEDRIGYKLSLR